MDPLTLLFSTEHDSQGLILGQGMMSFDIVTGFQELLNLPHSSSQELPEGLCAEGTMAQWDSDATFLQAEQWPAPLGNMAHGSGL